MLNSLVRVGLVALVLVTSAVQAASAQTAIRFSNDWIFEGTTSYLTHAVDAGFFGREGLDVTMDRGFGAGDVINRVASGAYQIGIGDLSALIDFNARNPDRTLVAVLMVHDRFLAPVVSTADRGVASLRDLAGRRVGALAGDSSTRLLPTLLRRNGVDPASVTIVAVSPQIRDTLLVRGELDAVLGFFSTATMNLQRLGVPIERHRMMRYSDFGIDNYGSAIITTRAFADQNPALMAGFVRAVARGLQATIADPAASIPSVLRRNSLTDAATELARLNLVLDGHIVTPATRAGGFGDVDDPRLATQIGFLVDALEMPRRPAPTEIFDRRFLPAADLRAIPR
jgi:NitT/TauT family transport system substrate-binding protein